MMIDKMRAWTILRYHDCAYLLSGAENVAKAHDINKMIEKLSTEQGKFSLWEIEKINCIQSMPIKKKYTKATKVKNNHQMEWIWYSGVNRF